MCSKLNLYRSDGSASFVAHALLNELAIPHESVVLESKDGFLQSTEMSHAEYRSLIHPGGFVPALQVDGQIITELPAVLTYIHALAPQGHLFGTTSIEKAKVYEWLIWLSSNLHGSGYGALWRPMRYTDDESEITYNAIMAKGLKNIMAAYTSIERGIVGNFFLGDQFIVVDLDSHSFWRWYALRVAKDRERLEKEHPKLTALAKRVERTTSVQRTLEEEHQQPAF